ncbi:hypothetical protein ACFVH7_39920 [Kitasatospora indigofera]|uniref:hypothetical protein n=1 Tax=Kitasatospora indigofera TaxID=67307 RepID=UPI0036354CCD
MDHVGWILTGMVVLAAVVAGLIGFLYWLCVRKGRPQDLPQLLVELRLTVGTLCTGLLPVWYRGRGQGMTDLQPELEPAPAPAGKGLASGEGGVL